MYRPSRVLQPESQAKANSVEKLVPHSQVLFKSKIDLSDQSRMGDRMPAKGTWTPQKVLFVSLDEFFNRIGWERSVAIDRFETSQSIFRTPSTP